MKKSRRGNNEGTVYFDRTPEQWKVQLHDLFGTRLTFVVPNKKAGEMLRATLLHARDRDEDLKETARVWKMNLLWGTDKPKPLPSRRSQSRAGVSKRSRFEVFERDHYTCRYCGRSAPNAVLHVDHVIPLARGGTADMDNLATACADCNQGKRDKQLADRSRPLVPIVRYVVPWQAILTCIAIYERHVSTLERDPDVLTFEEVGALIGQSTEEVRRWWLADKDLIQVQP